MSKAKFSWFLFLLGILLVLLSTSAQGSTPPSSQEEITTEFRIIRVKMEAIEDLTGAGTITPAQRDDAIRLMLGKASMVAGRQVTVTEILTIPGAVTSETPKPPALTALQRFAGLITFVNTMWVLAAFLGVSCFTFLFERFVADLIRTLKDVPVAVWEGLFYLISMVVLLYGTTCSEGVAPYVGFTGSLLLAGAVGWSFTHHKAFEGRTTTFFLILTLVYVPLALVYSSSLIGTLAVVAFMGTLGFSVWMRPHVVALGFESEAIVPKATAAAFTVLSLFVAGRMGLVPTSVFSVFEPGTLYLGSFVGYLGLLIMSSRLYGKQMRVNYFWMQVLSVVAGIASIAIGSIWQIPELQKIGGTLFVLYACEKYWEIPSEDLVEFAFKGLLFSGLIWVGSAFFKANMETLSPYFLF